MVYSESADIKKYLLPDFLIPAVFLTTICFLNPTLFSGFSALFVLLLSFAIFSLTVDSLDITGNDYIRIIGISFFFYGSAEFIRLLVPVHAGISEINSEFPPSRLIFLGESIRSFAFLAAPLLIGRRPANWNIFAYFALPVIVLAGLLQSGTIPGHIFENHGPPYFSRISVYMFAFSYLISLVLLAWKKNFLPDNIFILFSLSLILFSISEFCMIPAFKISKSVFPLGNLADILGLLAVRKAFQLACFTRPFSSLLLDLEHAKANFRNAAGIISANKQNSTILMCILDLNGNILSFNRACEIVTGYSENEVINTFVGDYYAAPEDSESARRFFSAGDIRDLSFVGEICWKAKDGSPRLLKWRVQAANDEKGEVISIICTGADVTGFAATGKELHFKNQVLEHANDSILVHSQTGKILYANEAFLEQTGYRKKDIISLSFDSIETAQSTGQNRHRLERLKQRGRAQYETVFKRRDGTPVQVEVNSAIVQMNGESMFVSVIRDISARKLYQKKLKDRYSELSTLYRISAAVSNSLTFGDLFPRILDSIIELGILDVERHGGIFVVEGEKLKLVSFVSGPESVPPYHGDVKIGDCLCGMAAKRDEIIFTRDITKECRYCGKIVEAVPRCHISIPLHAKNRLVGVMSLYLEFSASIDEPKINLLRAIGNQVAVALENAGLYEEMKNLALHDPLTGFANRRLMEIVFNRSMAEVKRFHEPLSVLMADIDFFKRYNDAHGHAKGDELLTKFARVLSEQVREIDFVSRYGGEEFLVILPGTELFEACIVAERIRKQVEEELGITVSLGAATFTQEIKNKEELIMRADSALYRAKQNGRNRVETAT